MSNEHGSQVKDQGRRQCCHNKHKKIPYRPTRDVSLLSGHALYNSSLCPSMIAQASDERQEKVRSPREVFKRWQTIFFPVREQNVVGLDL